jgi:peptide chain release factor 2
MRDRTRLATQIDAVRTIEKNLTDNIDLFELAEAEGDDALINDTHAAIVALNAEVQKKQLAALLSGEVDGNDAYLEVNAGAGGTEAMDWASMLLRMYVRWAERRGFRVTTLDISEGEEAGIKGATIKIEGEAAYGWLKTEGGVHRLVRISPFDANDRRHTSFASVMVSPVIDDTIEIEIDPKDLRVDTYRAQGAGGQHVNKTDSAIRLTHIPTGIVVACQQERSQHQNRATAMGMLKAKLYELELQKREADKNALQGEKTEIGWGHQIRSYVLQPYQMIKDLRTEFETTNSQAVLDGDIDGFLEASLAAKVTNKREG